MREYTIQQADAAPNWGAILPLAIDQPHKTVSANIRAHAKICYNREALLVYMAAHESDIRAEETGPLGMPCEDSCLEFFFCPIEGDMRYFNFEFNPNACMYLGIGSCLQDLTRLLPEGDGQIFLPRTARTQEGWEIEFRIPYSFIRRLFPAFDPQSQTAIRANCYKCGDRTAKPHYLAWSKITGKALTFHSPQSFGLMRFA